MIWFQLFFIKLKKHSYKLTLIQQSNSKIGDSGLQNVSYALRKCTNLSALSFSLDNLGLVSFNFYFILISFKHFRYNQIGGDGISSLFLAISNLQKLSALDLNLRFNPINFKGYQNLALALEKCTHLTDLTLDLVYNDIKDLSNLGYALAKCASQLTTLTLKLNQYLFALNYFLLFIFKSKQNNILNNKIKNFCYKTKTQRSKAQNQ
ncbi:hypothetical protein TTHERM_001040871 (macronuclear) [Tetrahymena thermophila SB210]|uniref:Uncharacterized protein n=1 Tax=Tetrahymena thermophila (strain SB210) TaxID=312017 RepID=W7X4Z1_TETTS|nr:hypothetical protein TTHERM_001040871 [Tetrahymena thermophila SB210]EWS71448.1 hypothetical protein TTHERM_001040871 [Tetrahymena thermophila SB210]|eukprot:XP_012656014.1 hypothetical protein TTHERM_001040871 [Tetrahymena thermophila SB210]